MPSASRINVVSRSSLIDCVFVSVISNLRTFTGHLMKILLNVTGTRYSIIDFRINRPLSLFKGKFNWWGGFEFYLRSTTVDEIIPMLENTKAFNVPI